MKRSRLLTVFFTAAALMICGCNNGGNVPSDTAETAATEATEATELTESTEATEATEAVSSVVETSGTAETEKGVDHGEMRDIDIHELVSEMKTGWNLGNALDSTGGETAWGNPKTTREMIDTVAAAGFNVIRIPTTWGDKSDDSGNISDEWIARVNEVVDYAFDNGMYVILNCHHETDWIKPSMSTVDSILPRYTTMWKQIAERFEPYGDHLLFEGLNEPRVVGGENEWSGGTEDGREALNVLNKAFVDTVRATGGNNGKRALLVPTFAAAVTLSAVKDLEVPDDDRVIVSLHAYTPYSYTYHSNESYEVFVVDEYVEDEINKVFKIMDKYFTEKNIPVIVTEYGSVSKSPAGETKRNDDENIKWVKIFLERAKQSGIPCVIWDNGYYYSGNELFGILNRSSCTWYLPDYIKAIMSVYE